MKSVKSKLWSCVRFAGTGALLAITVACAPEPPTLSPPSQAEVRRDLTSVVDDREIVALVSTEEAAGRLETRVTARGYQVLARERLGALGMTQFVLGLPPDQTPLGAIAEIEALERSATAGVNHAYTLQAESGSAREYAGALMEWPEGGCVALTAVGVIDGALDPSTPALSGTRVVQEDFTGGNALAAEHGTAIAALIGGEGRLTGATLYSAAVVGRGGDAVAGVDAMTRAMDWLAANDVWLVNVSLAGPYNKILDRAIQAAGDRGMVLVAAVGNSGPGTAPRYPAAFSQAIGVTAVDAAEGPYARAPEGSHIDFAAPGVDVFVPTGAGYMSGTSIAAPFVTAMIAAEPGLAGGGSASALRRGLAQSSRDLGPEGRDEIYGYGLPQTGGGCG
ncbi:S8 family serine peptidase [Amaricoccus macauensis]|uniref:S8 family serine peptidase n=1 Tax=Amaricoccus macauensis TaxID=57001 RepID=UPI003C7DEFB4